MGGRKGPSGGSKGTDIDEVKKINRLFEIGQKTPQEYFQNKPTGFWDYFRLHIMGKTDAELKNIEGQILYNTTEINRKAHPSADRVYPADFYLMKRLVEGGYIEFTGPFPIYQLNSPTMSSLIKMDNPFEKGSEGGTNSSSGNTSRGDITNNLEDYYHNSETKILKPGDKYYRSDAPKGIKQILIHPGNKYDKSLTEKSKTFEELEKNIGKIATEPFSAIVVNHVIKKIMHQELSPMDNAGRMKLNFKNIKEFGENYGRDTIEYAIRLTQDNKLYHFQEGERKQVLHYIMTDQTARTNGQNTWHIHSHPLSETIIPSFFSPADIKNSLLRPSGLPYTGLVTSGEPGSNESLFIISYGTRYNTSDGKRDKFGRMVEGVLDIQKNKNGIIALKKEKEEAVAKKIIKQAEKKAEKVMMGLPEKYRNAANYSKVVRTEFYKEASFRTLVEAQSLGVKFAAIDLGTNKSVDLKGLYSQKIDYEKYFSEGKVNTLIYGKTSNSAVVSKSGAERNELKKAIGSKSSSSSFPTIAGRKRPVIKTTSKGDTKVKTETKVKTTSGKAKKPATKKKAPAPTKSKADTKVQTGTKVKTATKVKTTSGKPKAPAKKSAPKPKAVSGLPKGYQTVLGKINSGTGLNKTEVKNYKKWVVKYGTQTTKKPVIAVPKAYEALQKKVESGQKLTPAQKMKYEDFQKGYGKIGLNKFVPI